MFEALRWRLTAWYVLVFVLVSVVVGLVVFFWADRRLTSDVNNAVEGVSAAAAQHASGYQTIGSADDDVRDLLAGASLGGSADVFVILIDPAGNVASNPSDVPLDGLPAAASVEAARARGSDRRSYTAGGHDLSIRTVSIHGPNGDLTGFVQAGKSVHDRERSLRTLAIVMAGGGVTGLALAAGGGLFLAGIAIRPVRRSFERQREFVADASHELRTPLAVIRVNAEAAARGGETQEAVSDIAAEATYMSRLLDDLLMLARGDSEGIHLQVDRVDIGELTRGAAHAIEPLMHDAGLSFSVDVAGGTLIVDADAERIREVLLVLMDNAAKYTPFGGSVRVHAFAAADEVVVEVSDTGIGIEAAEVDRVFDRFYRVDKARSRAIGGAGLGLSIAKGIADAHGGSLTIASTPGRGTNAILRIPRTPATSLQRSVDGSPAV